jgi:hypothetical protein
LQGRDKLGADLRRRRSEDRDETVTERSFLVLGYGFGLGVVFGGSPSFGYTVFEINNS